MFSYFMFFLVFLMGAILFFGVIILIPLLVYALPYTEWLQAARARDEFPKTVYSDRLGPIRKVLFNAWRATQWYYCKFKKRPFPYRMV